MSEDQATTQPETKALTLDDAVDAETLGKFAELSTARGQVAERLLDLEQEKIRTLRAASNIDTERHRLFERELTSRGLSPNAPVEINATTGKIEIVTGAPSASNTPA